MLPHLLAIAAFWVGALLAMSFLTTDWDRTVAGWTKVGLVAATCTAFWIGSGLRRADSAALRWLGRLCWVLLAGCYGVWLYLALVFGYLLGWTVDARLIALVGLLVLVAVATLPRPRQRLHLPLVLPLGIWIAAVLSGWLREEDLLRCDDLQALQPPVQLVVPNPELAECRPGAVRPSGRFPRTIWQAPDGDRIVFTTQGVRSEKGLPGSICEASLADPSAPVQCIGPPRNKSQGIIDLPEQDRLLVMQWGVPTPEGRLGGVVFELAREPGLKILAEHWFDELVGDGFYEPSNATLYMFSDRMNGIHRVRLPDFAPLPLIPSGVTPGELRYDRATGEGVTCGQGMGVAIRGAPYSERYFVTANLSPIDRLSMSWGCDWDREARRVYSTIPNFGLLDRIDYDTGKVEKRWFVGPGMRSVAYDRAGGRIYFTNFLRGEVVALDERSGQITNRWFVGRFSRWVRLTNDGRALLATGNLGVVRIPLDDVAAQP